MAAQSHLRSTWWAPGTRALQVVASLVLGAILVAGCGGDDAASPSDGPPPPAEAQRGLEVVRAQGCTACHSADGRDAIGPTWKGLHGSTVQLDDGSSVVADDEYLIRSIEEPDAQIREGFRANMPQRSLDADELDAVLAYLRAIGSDA